MHVLFCAVPTLIALWLVITSPGVGAQGVTEVADPAAYSDSFNDVLTTTIQKCCPEEEAFLLATNSCIHVNSSSNGMSSWVPPVVNMSGKWVNMSTYLTRSGQKFRPGNCESGHDFYQVTFPPKDIWSFVFSLNMTSPHLVVGKFKGHPEKPLLPWQHFCLDRVQSEDGQEMFISRMCVRNPCAEHVCVRKCCKVGPGVMQNTSSGPSLSCQRNATTPWVPERHRIHAFSAEPLEQSEQEKTHLLWGPPPGCQQTYVLDPTMDTMHQFYLDEQGQLYIPSAREGYSTDQYCVEMVGSSPMAVMCSSGQQEVIGDDVKGEGENAVYAALAILSMIGLVATFAVYWVLKELRNLHGWNIMSCVAALFWTFFFLSVNYLGAKTIIESSPGLCKTIAILVHYFFMAAMFWLSVMSWDLWRTFRSMRVQSGPNSQEVRRFMFYSLYAWGSPAIMSMITIVMEFSSGISHFYIKPIFAHNGCWFASKLRALVYFNGPMLVVLLANVVLFVMTTMKLVKVTKETKVLHDAESRRSNQNNRNRLFLHLKLMVVMGVTWVLEVLSALVGGFTYFWYVTDCINMLQGVLIFVIFVCKRNVLVSLNKKYDLVRNKRILGALSMTDGTEGNSQASATTHVSLATTAT